MVLEMWRYDIIITVFQEEMKFQLWVFVSEFQTRYEYNTYADSSDIFIIFF